MRLLQIGFGFAVRAAVDSVLSVGKPEFMDDFLLGCGDAAGILAAENIDQCRRQVEFFLFDDFAVLHVQHHAGIDIGLPEPVHCPPDKVARVIDALKPKKMILAHLGGWKQWEDVYECLAGKQVYFDTSFILDYIEQELFLKILNKHGHEKVLFATDSPWSDVGKAVEMLRSMPLSKNVIEDILSENAKKLWQI